MTINRDFKRAVTILHLMYDQLPEHALMELNNSKERVTKAVELYDLGFYKKVAVVMASDLDEAFFLSQHIDAPWQHNRVVEMLDDKDSPRSTSVGDIFAFGQNEVYIIGIIGVELSPIILRQEDV